MRSICFVAALALVLAPGLPSVCAGFDFFRNSWGDVIVATDTTPEGRGLTPPTRDRPVYYLGKSLGCKLGSIGGDEMPGVQEMTNFITKILARQGYLGARPGVHEPALYVIVQWGYLKSDLLWFLGYDANQDIASPVFPGILGPEVFRRHFRSRTIETILENANDAIYGIIVTAFEYKSVDTSKPAIYWQTRIGLPAHGKSMTQALPAMLVAAGAAIGRERDSPMLLDVDKVREGSVRLGELQILDVMNEPVRGTDSDPK